MDRLPLASPGRSPLGARERGRRVMAASPPEPGQAYHLISGDSEPASTSIEVDVEWVAEEQSWRERLLDFVQGVPFQTSMALAIIANAVVIGLETDVPEYSHWGLLENIFLIVFALELIARLVAFGFENFFDMWSDDFCWNFFDAIIVMIGVVDSLILIITENEKGGSFSTLFRIVRIFRILRIFKIIRFLKQLYLLAHGFIEAAQSVFWVTTLMVFVLYVCSIVLVRTVGNLPQTDEHTQFLHEQYGTILKSMLSLFDLMSEPDMHPYHGMRGTYPFLTIFLIAWIIFGSFGMIALLTGVISESMFEKNALRIEAEHLEREQKRNALNARLGEVFDLMIEKDLANGERRSEVSLEEVHESLPSVMKVFDEAFIAYSRPDMEFVVNIMDTDESGGVNKEEFVHGLVSIAEEIRPMSIAELFHSVQLVKARVAKCQNSLDNFQQAFQQTNGDNLSAMQDKIKDVMEGFKQAIQESNRECFSNLEKKINESAKAQVKAAADSSLTLETLQSLAAGSPQQQVLGVPAVDNYESRLVAKLAACETGILETKVLVSDLQDQLKKSSVDNRNNPEFSCAEGTSSKDIVGREPTTDLPHSVSEMEAKASASNAGQSEVTGNANLDLLSDVNLPAHEPKSYEVGVGGSSPGIEKNRQQNGLEDWC